MTAEVTNRENQSSKWTNVKADEKTDEHLSHTLAGGLIEKPYSSLPSKQKHLLQTHAHNTFST